jgi:hypothetical protein
VPAWADSLDVRAASDSGGCHCFAGKPYPRCHDFWVVEIGPGILVGSSIDWLNPGSAMVASDFGFMKNFRGRSALGLTAFGATDADRSRAGVRLRYRRWLSPKTALDLSPGLLVIGSNNGPISADINYPSFMATASISYASRVSVFAGVECLRTNDRYDFFTNAAPRGKSIETVFWAGVSGGSEVGLAGFAALLGLMVVMAATYS